MNGCAIPYTPIAVDFWKTRQCPRVKFFFLTHGYVDQTCGLSHSWSMPIYCGPITRNILLSKFSIRPEIVHELELNVQHSIFLSDSEEDCIKVMLVNSNYCPGSVMFFFEGYFGRILYTGNFRFCESMLSQTPLQAILKNSIDVLYLDNTYCNSRCAFPTKESVMESIREIVEKCHNRKVLIALRSHGKEELLIYLSKCFKEKIKVNEDRLKVLNILKEDQNFTVNNFISTSIDVVPFSDIFQKSNYDVFSTEPSICIVPTGLFTALGYNPFENQSNIFLVPYSNHSCYSELIKFVSIVHPKSIVPLNKPVIDPLSGALMDRSNVDCFQEYLNKSPMHHYHIPQSVLKVMNQSSVPRSKRLSKTCLKKDRKRSEPIYVGSLSSEVNKDAQKERRTSVPKCLMTSTLNRNGNEMLVKSNVNQINPCRRISHTTSQPMKIIKRCKSLDSFSSLHDCRPHICQQANSIDLNMSPFQIISNINFYQVSNLVRCHRARLCIPEQCKTVCHSKTAVECSCTKYCHVQSRPRYVDVSAQFRNVSNTTTRGGFIFSNQLNPTIDNCNKSTNNLSSQPTRKCSISTISNKLSAIGLSNYSTSCESKTPPRIDVISTSNVGESSSKVLKRCQNQSGEVIKELPPKKKWCNKFNTSQLDEKVSSENKNNLNPMRRRLGTTANPMDVGLNTIATVPAMCTLSNSNYGNLTSNSNYDNISSCSPTMKLPYCRNSMKVMHFNSQDCTTSTSYLCQPVLPIDLSISKA